jgi:hypothetical protein
MWNGVPDNSREVAQECSPWREPRVVSGKLPSPSGAKDCCDTVSLAPEEPYLSFITAASTNF